MAKRVFIIDKFSQPDGRKNLRLDFSWSVAALAAVAKKSRRPEKFEAKREEKPRDEGKNFVVVRQG